MGGRIETTDLDSTTAEPWICSDSIPVEPARTTRRRGATARVSPSCAVREHVDDGPGGVADEAAIDAPGLVGRGMDDLEPPVERRGMGGVDRRGVADVDAQVRPRPPDAGCGDDDLRV